MRKFISAVVLAVLVGLSLPTPASGYEKSPSTGFIAVVLPVEYQSQLAEPAPSYWQYGLTPYCAVASSFMVLRSFGIQVQGLEANFYLGRQGNSTWDLGLDPDGVSYLMRQYGGEGTIHSYWNRDVALTELVGRLNWGSPVVVFGQSGNHAQVVYGYEGLISGEGITAFYVADPLTGFMGRVDANEFFFTWQWFGVTFTAPGEKWQGSWTFVSYRDFR